MSDNDHHTHKHTFHKTYMTDHELQNYYVQMAIESTNCHANPYPDAMFHALT